jgi:hypothetical protein
MKTDWGMGLESRKTRKGLVAGRLVRGVGQRIRFNGEAEETDGAVAGDRESRLANGL